MKFKANVSFCGKITMKKGEVREFSDISSLSPLLKAGYISEVSEGNSSPSKAKGAKVPKEKSTKKAEGKK